MTTDCGGWPEGKGIRITANENHVGCLAMYKYTYLIRVIFAMYYFTLFSSLLVRIREAGEQEQMAGEKSLHTLYICNRHFSQ